MYDKVCSCCSTDYLYRAIYLLNRSINLFTKMKQRPPNCLSIVGQLFA